MPMLEKPDRAAEERKIMLQHAIVHDSLLNQLREEAVVSAREQVSERLNRRNQVHTSGFYNFKK